MIPQRAGRSATRNGIGLHSRGQGTYWWIYATRTKDFCARDVIDVSVSFGEGYERGWQLPAYRFIAKYFTGQDALDVFEELFPDNLHYIAAELLQQ